MRPLEKTYEGVTEIHALSNSEEGDDLHSLNIDGDLYDNVIEVQLDSPKWDYHIEPFDGSPDMWDFTAAHRGPITVYVYGWKHGGISVYDETYVENNGRREGLEPPDGIPWRYRGSGRPRLLRRLRRRRR